eukprot:4925486-Alexandrium_andersonii.AAC.1
MCIRDRSTASPGIPFESPHGPKVLPLTHAYKHMGGMLTASASPAPEVDARCSAAVGTLAQVRKGALAQPR